MTAPTTVDIVIGGQSRLAVGYYVRRAAFPDTEVSGAGPEVAAMGLRPQCRQITVIDAAAGEMQRELTLDPCPRQDANLRHPL